MNNIMIVDNEHPFQHQLTQKLADSQYSIIHATSSKEALEHLENIKTEKPVDLILIKTQLPGTEQQGYFSMKPGATLKTARTNAFLPLSASFEEIHIFLQQELNK